METTIPLNQTVQPTPPSMVELENARPVSGGDVVRQAELERRQQHDRRIAALRDQYQKELEMQKTSTNTSLSSLKARHKLEKRELKEKQAEEIRRVKADYNRLSADIKARFFVVFFHFRGKAEPGNLTLFSSPQRKQDMEINHEKRLYKESERRLAKERKALQKQKVI